MCHIVQSEVHNGRNQTSNTVVCYPLRRYNNMPRFGTIQAFFEMPKPVDLLSLGFFIEFLTVNCLLID